MELFQVPTFYPRLHAYDVGRDQISLNLPQVRIKPHAFLTNLNVAVV